VPALLLSQATRILRARRFPTIVAHLAQAAVPDGEVVASNADDRPNIARLHVRWTRPVLSTSGCDKVFREGGQYQWTL